MTKREPLPPEFSGRPFRSSDARKAGISRSRVRRAAPYAVAHGIRSAVEVAIARDRDIAYARCMRADAALASISALRFWGLPLRREVEEEHVTFVSVAADKRPLKGERIVGSALTEAFFDVREADGLRVVAPRVAWAQAAGVLDARETLVVADALLALEGRYPGRWFRGPYSTASELQTSADRWIGRRGARALRAAAALARPGSESPGESRTRYEMVRAGFPEPVLNLWVTLAPGRNVRIDLAYPELRIAIEYQGEHHFDPKQAIDDIERIRDLQLSGWIVLQVTKRDVTRPATFFEQLRRAIELRTA